MLGFDFVFGFALHHIPHDKSNKGLNWNELKERKTGTHLYDT